MSVHLPSISLKSPPVNHTDLSAKKTFSEYQDSSTQTKNTDSLLNTKVIGNNNNPVRKDFIVQPSELVSPASQPIQKKDPEDVKKQIRLLLTQAEHEMAESAYSFFQKMLGSARECNTAVKKLPADKPPQFHESVETRLDDFESKMQSLRRECEVKLTQEVDALFEKYNSVLLNMGGWEVATPWGHITPEYNKALDRLHKTLFGAKSMLLDDLESDVKEFRSIIYQSYHEPDHSIFGEA